MPSGAYAGYDPVRIPLPWTGLLALREATRPAPRSREVMPAETPQDPCQNCGGALPRPSGSACRADPCHHCRHPRPLGDCSDLTLGPPTRGAEGRVDR